ncbi:MAG TPA: gluconate 2-dehydrogenase subunit 3 family protein [Terriglobia bacterium]|nr:gluconate 2-dehydrogenase subunit 3 family protein [Terriglobia bacterium]
MAENEKGKHKGAIRRRDMLKVFSAVPAAALVPLGTAVMPPAKMAASTTAKAASVYTPKVFNNHEWETIKALSDLIIPADDRSGSATQAGVPEFIDDWLDFRGGSLKAEILGGLTWLDLECNRQFGQDFIGCTPPDRKKILDRIAYPDKAVPEDLNYVAFFNRLRDLVVSGFFSSEQGVKDLPYQGNQMVANWEGCPPNVLAEIEKNLKATGVALSIESDKTSA